MPVERLGGDAERAIDSVLGQTTAFDYELIVVSAAELKLSPDSRLRNVVEVDRNPAVRRNRAVASASGELLAFIDDDARADPAWLATAAAYFEAHPDVLAIGGPDPAPEESSVPELISDTLLSTPLIGSGVAAHECRRGIFDITSPTDLALVNLFVRRSAFEPFDASIGYVGEDTALIERLMERGRVVYHDGVRVVHRRRAFPGPYLRQRWFYRVKTGEMIVRGSRAHRSNRKIQAFMVAGTMAILLAPIVVVPYALLTLVLGARATRLPKRLWPVIPPAFALHHATYFFGIAYGMARAALR